MAKKKSNKFEKDAVSNSMITKYGDIIESGDKVLADLEELKVISVSPALDHALGGGLREGSCVAMTGDPKAGKTTTALYFAAKCQAAGKKVYYLNTEGRITKENFIGIKGLDASKIKIIQPTDSAPLVSAEMYLNTLEAHIKGTPDLVAIVDSVSSMLPQDELDGDVRTGVRNQLPKLLAMFLKRISGDVARNRAIIIFVTHNIANTGGSRYAPAKHADSGNMLQYQVSTNMIITHRGKWEDKDGGDDIGQVAHWLIKTSAAGGIPMSKADSWIKYGIGIDEAKEMVEIGIELSMIKKKGSWYTINVAIENPTDKVIKAIIKKNDVEPTDAEAVEKLFKAQGLDPVTDILNDNPALIGFIQRKIGEVM